MTTPDSSTDVLPVDDPRSEIRLFDVAAVFFVSMITAVAGFGIGTAIGGEGSYAETCAGLIGLWCGLIPGSFVILKVRESGSFVRDLRLRFEWPGDLKGVLYGLGSQFILLPLVYVVVQWLASRDLSEDLEAPARDLTENARGPGFLFLAVLLVVGAPLVEEIFYRGMLLRSLRRYLPVWPTIILNGIVFGAVHFEPITLPGLAVFGAVLAWLTIRADRLGPAIVAHAAFNAATVVALWNA